MLWALIAVPAALLVLPRLARRRRGRTGLQLFETVSPLSIEPPLHQSRRARTALDSATGLLAQPGARTRSDRTFVVMAILLVAVIVAVLLALRSLDSMTF